MLEVATAKANWILSERQQATKIQKENYREAVTGAGVIVGFMVLVLLFRWRCSLPRFARQDRTRRSSFTDCGDPDCEGWRHDYFSYGGERQGAIARADVVRRCSTAGPGDDAGRRQLPWRRWKSKSIRPRIHTHRRGTIFDQDAGPARGIDPPRDGRASPRNHREVHRGADRQRAGNGRRPDARDLRGRYGTKWVWK